jgi:hypothetical protein
MKAPRWRAIDGLAELQYGCDGRATFAALHAADVVAVDAGREAELFLRQPSLEPYLAPGCPQRSQQLIRVVHVIDACGQVV